MWNVYSDDGPGRPVEPDGTAIPGLAPPPPVGLDPIEIVVDGECFVVTHRPGSPGTYDFDWTNHPEAYGFAVGRNPEWRPDRTEMTDEIRIFLAQVDKDTGYLRD